MDLQSTLAVAYAPRGPVECGGEDDDDDKRRRRAGKGSGTRDSLDEGDGFLRPEQTGDFFHFFPFLFC